MVSFVEKYKLIHETQFGFRKGHATSHGIMHLNEKILKNIENKKITAVLFMDLKSAFDTVNHDILLKKLEHIGFRDSMLKLLESYLSERKQYVKNGNIESVLLDVVCGVPQGSVLGPLLFTLYINDIVNSSGLGNVLFADDAALIAAENSLKKLQKTINHEIPKLFKWLCGSKLTLNYTKTKYIYVVWIGCFENQKQT